MGIIFSLLTLIFLVVYILPSSPKKIIELLAGARRYQVGPALSHIRSIICAKKVISPEAAFHMYFLAQHHGLHHEALQAARVTLSLSMTLEDLGDKLDFPGMTGAYLHELWKYRERVQTDLKSSILEFIKSGLPDDVRRLHCHISDNHFQVPDASPPRWLDEYIKSMTEAPLLFDPIGLKNEWARHIRETWAHYSRTCSCVYLSSLLSSTFVEALTAVFDKTIEKADSTLALVKEEPISENLDPSFVPLRLDVPEANIILRSSDQVSFRVHKSLLAMSSPLFEDLLSLPQPPDQELVDGLPVVQLSEGADLLNCLVSFLYPIRRVEPGSYEKVFALLSACQKYDMVSIQSYVRDEVKRGTFPAPAKAEAFSAYAIANSLGLIPEMEDAARLTLGQPITFESLGEGLRLFKGSSLCELVRYRVASKSPSNQSQGHVSRRGRGSR